MAVVYEYIDLTLDWEIWESGGRAAFFDGKNDYVRRQLTESGMEHVRSFQASDVNEAHDVFTQWAQQQHPPVGSLARAQLFAIDTNAKAIQ